MPSETWEPSFEECGVHILKSEEPLSINELIPVADSEPYTYLLRAEQLENVAEQAECCGVYAGISRKFSRPDEMEQAIFEADIALLQDFFDSESTTMVYPYISRSCGRINDILQIIGAASVDQDPHVAGRLLRNLRNELKSGGYNIRQALYALYTIQQRILHTATHENCLSCIAHSRKYDCNLKKCRELYMQYGDLDVMFEEAAEQVQASIRANIRDEMENTSEVVQAMVSYINENYFADITLKRLSEQFYLNPGYICRIFKRDVGLPLSSYLVQLRIRHACRMLHYSEKTVAEIAQRCGYGDYFYFARQFKRVMHITPSQYRQQAREVE